MKFLTSAAASALLLVPAIAGAQTAPASPSAPPAATQTSPASPSTPPAAAQATAPTVGATVYDSTGAVLGTVDQVTPQAVVVNVGGTKVGLPPAAVGAGPTGLRVGTTRADILAQAQQAQAGQQAQLTSQLTAGTTVRGAAGASVGTVKSADSQYVTLTTAKGDVKLPISAFSAGANGPAISMTATQLDEAITAAGGGANSTTSATTTGSTAEPGADAASSDAAVAAGTGAAAAAGAATAAKASTTTTARKRTATRRSTRRTSR